jgi:hypothetical protein
MELAIQHPAVPPFELVHSLAISIPAAELVGPITKQTPARLKALYTSACRAYWPLCDLPRPKVSAPVLLESALLLQQAGVRPAQYMEWVCERTYKIRKSPQAIQFVFDPAEVAENIRAVGLAGADTASSTVTSTYVGAYLREVARCITWVHREIRLLSSYDAEKIADLSLMAFPGGWRSEVDYAERYIAAQQARLHLAAKEGQFIWGRATSLMFKE